MVSPFPLPRQCQSDLKNNLAPLVKTQYYHGRSCSASYQNRSALHLIKMFIFWSGIWGSSKYHDSKDIGISSKKMGPWQLDVQRSNPDWQRRLETRLPWDKKKSPAAVVLRYPLRYLHSRKWIRVDKLKRFKEISVSIIDVQQIELARRTGFLGDRWFSQHEMWESLLQR